MTNKQIIELAKKAGLPISMFQTGSQLGDELKLFAELVRNEAIDRRVKVKIGNQYGNDLHGHWFYLQPADEDAQKVLDNRSMKK